jgi:hypothetical protein
MTARIIDGLRAAARNLKLTWLLWAWYGLLAIVPAFPVWRWWDQVLGASPEAAAILKRFDLGVFLDLTRSEGVGGLGLMSAAVAAAAGIAIVSSAFAFGGILEVVGAADDHRPFMHRFFRGGGRFFWRFLRLAVMAAAGAVLATGLVSALMTAVTRPLSESEWEPGFYLASALTVAAILITAALFLLALDYARIRVARDDSRRMIGAYAAGMGFVLRRALRVYGIAIAFVALEAAFVVGYLAYETNAPAAGTWGAIAALFLVQQVVVASRVFLRVAMVAAERSFYATGVPLPVPTVPPAITVPDISTPAEHEEASSEGTPT